MKEIKVNEYWVDLYNQTGSAVEDFAVLFEFWKAGDATEEETKAAYDKALTMLDDAEFKATLNEPEDELPAVLQINSVQVEQKARIGQRYLHVCIVCMEKSRDGK
jgi:hypothetical protein